MPRSWDDTHISIHHPSEAQLPERKPLLGYECCRGQHRMCLGYSEVFTCICPCHELWAAEDARMRRLSWLVLVPCVVVVVVALLAMRGAL